jgi:hypothetical protein
MIARPPCASIAIAGCLVPATATGTQIRPATISTSSSRLLFLTQFLPGFFLKKETIFLLGTQHVPCTLHFRKPTKKSSQK